MGPCNSHKCHCPRCIAARGVKAYIDLDHRIDERIADQFRREEWKRRAARHHIDRAGVCCAPHAPCTCPNCIEVREFDTIRPGERINWIWVRLPHGWRRKEIATQRFFGETMVLRNYYPKRATGQAVRTRTVGAASPRYEVTIYETNPNSVNNWVRSIFTDPPAYVSREQATELYRRWQECYWHDSLRPALSTPEVRAAFVNGDWTEKKEHPVLTPIQLAILSYHAAFSGHRWPSSGPQGGVDLAYEQLFSLELLEFPDAHYVVSERAKVLLGAINAVPLPIRKPAPWTMPS